MTEPTGDDLMRAFAVGDAHAFDRPDTRGQWPPVDAGATPPCQHAAVHAQPLLDALAR